MIELDEATITSAILSKALDDLLRHIQSDVIVVGAGPAGLTAARYLALGGAKTVVFERNLSFGGGTGGGGMLMPRVVVQKPADGILRELNVKLEPAGKEIFTADPVEIIAKLAVGAVDAGAKIFLGMTVNDLIFREDAIVGAVCQWTPVMIAKMHVDPLSFKSKAVIDCTGHEAAILKIAAQKIPELELEVPGEKAMWSSISEKLIVERTGEVRPGLFVAGMAVAQPYRLPRMGPIFGGMLLSGKKVAELILRKLAER